MYEESLWLISAPINVVEPEKQDDCRDVVRAGHHARNLVLKCTIRADPPASDFSVSWREMGREHIIREGEDHQRYRLVIKQGVCQAVLIPVIKYNFAFLHRKDIFNTFIPKRILPNLFLRSV